MRFKSPDGITVDPAGNVVVVDYRNHALRLVSKAGAVSTLAGGGGRGFAYGQGATARFNLPVSVVVTANGDYVMTDCGNHALRVVTPGGAVRTLAGNGEPGFVDGQGAAARFNYPLGLALDVDESILVIDCNHAVRRLAMAGAVSTVAGNGQKGYADGEGAAARFNQPTAVVVVDKEGTIKVADMDNHRLRRLTGRHVTTLAGGSRGGHCRRGRGRRALPYALPAGAGRARAPARHGSRPSGHAAGGGGVACAAAVDGPGGGGGGRAARRSESGDDSSTVRLRQAGGGARAGQRGAGGRGGASPRTATCWWRGASTFAGCCCRGCRRAAGRRRSS